MLMTTNDSSHQLELCISERSLLVSNTDSLGVIVGRYLCAYLSEHKDHLPTGQLYTVVMNEVEKALLAETLKITGGNQKKASEILGINRNTLRKKTTEIT